LERRVVQFQSLNHGPLVVAVGKVILGFPALKSMTGGGFKSELIPISAVGMNQIKVQQMLDRVGFK
ncbi:MAG: hypothetical protein ACKOXU_03650, partial [Limnohabitans sp.]